MDALGVVSGSARSRHVVTPVPEVFCGHDDDDRGTARPVDSFQPAFPRVVPSADLPRLSTTHERRRRGRRTVDGSGPRPRTWLRRRSDLEVDPSGERRQTGSGCDSSCRWIVRDQSCGRQFREVDVVE